VIQSLHRTLLLGLLVASVNFIPSLLQASDANESPTRQFTYSDAAILGLVEGITEYLPVSSTGHLILTNAALGLDSETPLLNRDGEILWIEDSESADGQRPFTLSNAADAYAIIIQFGAILAVVILYWKRLLTILMGVLGKDPDGLRLLRNLVVTGLKQPSLASSRS
jgi:undecaprenyl-diphosphatase